MGQSSQPPARLFRRGRGRVPPVKGLGIVSQGFGIVRAAAGGQIEAGLAKELDGPVEDRFQRLLTVRLFDQLERHRDQLLIALGQLRRARGDRLGPQHEHLAQEPFGAVFLGDSLRVGRLLIRGSGLASRERVGRIGSGRLALLRRQEWPGCRAPPWAERHPNRPICRSLWQSPRRDSSRLPQPSSEKRQSAARDPMRAAAASAVVRVEIAMGLSIR